MNPAVAGAIAGVAEGITNTGLGLLLEGHQDRRQVRQQGRLGEQQLGFDQRYLDYQQEKAYSMWERTNYGAQLEQMDKAGLSAGLMYGGSGGGGATTGQPSGGSKAQPAAMTQNVMGMQLLGHQMKLMQAQTEKIHAETDKTKGVDTAEAETRITDLKQGIMNKKAQERLTGIQGNIATIEEQLKTDTYEDTKATIGYTASKTMREMNILRNDNMISDDTMEEKVGLVQGELIGLGLANEAKRVGIKLTEEQTKATVEKVKQGWEQLSIGHKQAMASIMTSKAARENANTNIREFLEEVRNNDMNVAVKEGALRLQQMIQDVPESTKLTVSTFTSIFGSVTSMFKRR